MHEVARHVIHTSEMLQTALNATESLLGEVAGLPGEHGTVDKENVSDENAVYVKTMLQCILLRSQALEKRIQNELQFVRIQINPPRYGYNVNPNRSLI